MNIFAFSSLLIIISNLSCALILLFSFNRSNKKLNIIWIIVCIMITMWGLGAFKFSSTTSKSEAFFWWQIAHIGVIFIPITYYTFIHAFLKLNKPYQKFIHFCIYFIGFSCLYLTFFTKNIFLGELKFVFNQFYIHAWFIKKNVLYLLFYILVYWILLLYLFILLIYYRTQRIVQNQIKYFILASVIAWLGPHCEYLLIIFNLNIYPYSNFFIAIFPAIVTYTIIKYRLIDIKLVFTRATIFIAVYTLVLGFPFLIAGLLKNKLMTIIGQNWWFFPLGLMAVLATTGPFIYIFLQRRAEERIFREQKRYQDVLKHAAIGMTRIRPLKKLLSMITRIITKTVHISFAAIYLYDQQADNYSIQVFRGQNKEPLTTLSPDSSLIKWLIQKQEPLIYEEIKRQMEDSKEDSTFKTLEANMRLLAASVLVPSFLDQKLSGFLVLGDKLSKQIYTPDDLNVFQVLASQAALAIENAQFYEEAKEMQAQIAQAEKMATIGTMADGLSHQINNRFYALSLIAGDSIDTVKMTDSSGCSPEIQEMLKQIKTALERIQVNVMQGGEVVKGILKYTRKGDEGLEALTIDQILKGTIDMVQFKVKLSEIDIIRDYPKDIPQIKANLVQMQEVFFNFIDNAYDSIVERRNTLKEENYRGKITISAKLQNETMQIFIKDNGMGVKNENIKKIFTPFFTTKASSRKGTGLGLYVIRNIIVENHKGKIDFHSEYKSGTSFTIEIPRAPQG